MASNENFWDIQKKEKPYQKFLYPQVGVDIDIRFIGKQEQIYQTWDNASRKFNFHETKPDTDRPSQRLASLVVDRKDGKIKVCSFPMSVFRQMQAFGPHHDFRISKTGMGLQTRYSVQSLGETPLPEENVYALAILEEYSLFKMFSEKKLWGDIEAKKKEEDERIENRWDILDL